MPILAFIGVALSGFLLPLPLFVLVAVAYALWRPGYELIILGICIDAQFGLGDSLLAYRYTLILGAVVLALNVLKPHLTFYRT